VAELPVAIAASSPYRGSRLLQNVTFYQITWHYIPEGSNLHVHCSEYLKSEVRTLRVQNFCTLHPTMEICTSVNGARSSVVVNALCYNPEGHGFETRWGDRIFPIYLILPSALGLGFTQPVTEMSTGSRKVMFLGSRVRTVSGLTTLLPSVSRLSRQCGILNISQPCRPPRPVTGIAFTSVSTTRAKLMVMLWDLMYQVSEMLAFNWKPMWLI
jgi:hypothetical protein